MKRALILDQENKKVIQDLCKFADANKINLDRLTKIANGSNPPVGDLPGYRCTIEQGFRVVFSIEEHPCGWCRHMSVSVDGGKMPSVPAVEELMKEFGFRGTVMDCENVSIEQGVTTESGVVDAINVLQLVEG